MVLRGLIAGNSIDVVTSRALVGLFGGVAFGALIGWVGMIVVADNPPPAPDGMTEAAPNANGSNA